MATGALLLEVTHTLMVWNPNCPPGSVAFTSIAVVPSATVEIVNVALDRLAVAMLVFKEVAVYVKVSPSGSVK